MLIVFVHNILSICNAFDFHCIILQKTKTFHYYTCASVNNDNILHKVHIFFRLSIFLQIRHDYRTVIAMPCSASLQKIEKVDRCPRNALEWDVRAALFNCSSINQTCVTSDMFQYHCVSNAYGTELLEVCAVYKFIYGN